MQLDGQKAYLDIKEQKLSGYSSPIDITEFDFHAERLVVDGELDDLHEMSSLDPHELTHEQRASLPSLLETYEMKSMIVRGRAREVALRAVVSGDGVS